MTVNRKRKRFDDFILMFNNKFFPMSKYSSNNILPLQFLSNEVGESIDFDSAMGVNFSDKTEDEWLKGMALGKGIRDYEEFKTTGFYQPEVPVPPPSPPR